MFDIIVTEEQISYAKELVAGNNFGNRGIGDGSPEEQLTGMIGQTVFADLISAPRPVARKKHAGWYDFTVNGKKVHIKTMTRSVPLMQDYVHNFIAFQKDYEVDFYVFASFNKKSNILTIGGCISKEGFDRLAVFYPAGTQRFRDDGSSFVNITPNYEIKQSLLRQVYSPISLLEMLK
ncbi:MAG: hypothetical protein IJ555_10690 [Ruminococcus sp.]|nr:hypothetical protein [Ruminococcus sp.]